MFSDAWSSSYTFLSANKDHVEELIANIATTNCRTFDEFYKKIDAIYFPLNNSIAPLSHRMEELDLKMD